jgi:phospholipase/carboxylesterase
VDEEPVLPCVEIEPDGPPIGTVLWLHGLGASGHDFEDVVPLLELPRVRFVFPHAPVRAVTVNLGLIMPAWYDIRTLPSSAEDQDERGIRESARRIEALLAREEQRGVPSDRIVLAGFSQGAAIALFVGIRHPKPLLGIMVLSGGEPLAWTREAEASPANRRTPLLVCHGLYDPLVSVARGREAYDAYARDGRPAEWHEFPIPHQVSLDEIGVIRDWLTARFATPAADERGLPEEEA